MAWQYPAYRNVTLRLLEPLGAPVEAVGPGFQPAAGLRPGVALSFHDVTVRVCGHTILEDIAPGGVCRRTVLAMAHP